VGTGVDYGQPENWQKGKRVWIPVDDVAQIVEFNNIDEVKSEWENVLSHESRHSRAACRAVRNDKQPLELNPVAAQRAKCRRCREL
jgi:hypothetical protein